MAKLTTTAAARQLGIARSTLYKLIDHGKVSAIPDGMIDQAELVRIATCADVRSTQGRALSRLRVAPVVTCAGALSPCSWSIRRASARHRRGGCWDSTRTSAAP